MLPVLSREVVEAEQGVAILDQALDRLVVFDAPGLDEDVEGGKRIRLGFGHPDFLQCPLGFRLLAVWQFVEDVGGFVHPAALPAGVGPRLFDGLPKAKRAIGDRQLRANRQPTPLQIEEQFPPRLRTFAYTVAEADKLLPALGCGSDNDQQALRAVFETGLHMNAVGPEVDVAFGREIALAPARVLLGPGLLEPSNGRGREPAGVPAEQCDQRFLEVAGRDALEVEDRDQHLQALRPARVGRQNCRRKADALATFAAAVTHARAAHSHRTDAGHDLTLGQMPWRTNRRRPSSVSLSAWQLSKLETSASTACARSARAPLRKTSVSGSVKVPGCESWKTLVSVTAYHSFAGEVEASNTPTIRRLTPSRRHQLSPIAQRG